MARRRFARPLIGCGVLLGLVVAGWFGYSRGWPAYQQWQARRAAIAAWERCLAFSTPADQVAFSEEPPTRRTSPPELRALSTVDTLGWTLSWRHSDSLLFMHERTSAPDPAWQRERQLVLVQFIGFGSSSSGSGWTCRVIEILPTWQGDLGIRDYWVTVPTSIQWVLPGPHLRFYAGQPDPADASRFTIKYDVNGEEGILEGRIAENHEPHLSGPATRPAN
jgi:hypothetical protein